MLVNWRIWGITWARVATSLGCKKRSLSRKDVHEWTERAQPRRSASMKNRAIQCVTEGKGQPFCRQDTSHHAMALYRSAQFFYRRWDVLER